MLRLRPYKSCDAAVIAGWVKDEVSFRKWCSDRLDTYPVTAKSLNAYYDARKDADDFYEMTAFDEDGIAGHLTMRFLDSEKTILRFGFVIVDDQKRGRGYGRQMLSLALTYAFDILKARRVTLGVFENNETAHRCYLAAGFRDVELPEKRYVSILGEKWNCLEMEIDGKGTDK